MVLDAVTGMQDLFALHPAYDVILYPHQLRLFFPVFFRYTSSAGRKFARVVAFADRFPVRLAYNGSCRRAGTPSLLPDSIYTLTGMSEEQ